FSAALKDEARSLGLERDVLFLGQRDDPENFYPGQDIVALTSLNEGTPLTLIEAMANERAVVARAVGGVVDLVGDETGAPLAQSREYALCERGVSVSAGALPRGFAAGLWTLVENEKVRREMGARGRRFIENHYSKERLISDVTKLYQELLHTQTARPEGDLSTPATHLRAIKRTSLKEE
ncbi:MAG: glycosyltransferase, partial [Acidobacteria bacterium]|nr:glycosyltransferase [Acidobacteriota bacterium]